MIVKLRHAWINSEMTKSVLVSLHSVMRPNCFLQSTPAPSEPSKPTPEKSAPAPKDVDPAEVERLTQEVAKQVRNCYFRCKRGGCRGCSDFDKLSH